VLVAAGLVVLLAVVALASHSGFGHGSKAKPNNTYFSYAFTVFLILFVVTIPVTIWAWIVRTREQQNVREVSLKRRSAQILMFVAVFSLLVWIRHWFHFHFHTPWHNQGSAPGGTRHHGTGKAAHGHTINDAAPTFQWTVLWVALALAAVGVVASIYLYRRSRPEQKTLEDLPVAQDIAETISDAIDDLEREPDPRRAVIAAYARMEGVLGRHGLRRNPSETPLEYLRRVLLDVTASSDAVERLTALFERAKFSQHDVTEAMKREAIDALAEIREGIA